jgi:hypothetical protein
MITWEPQRGIGLAFLVGYNMDAGGPELRIANRQPDGSFHRAEINWVEVKMGEQTRPTLQCYDHEESDDLQALFNALWKVGYRPKQAMKQDAVIEAKDSHLADLRKLLFNMQGVPD